MWITSCRSLLMRKPVWRRSECAFELMKSMIEASAAAVHFESGVGEEMRPYGGRCWSPAREAVETGCCASAADVMGVPTLRDCVPTCGCGRSDYLDARPMTAVFVPANAPARFLPRMRALSELGRGLAYAPRMPIWWCETSAGYSRTGASFCRCYPRSMVKLLAYNCSPSFNWQKKSTLATRPLPTSSSSLRRTPGYKYRICITTGGHPQHVVQHVDWRRMHTLRAGM